MGVLCVYPFAIAGFDLTHSMQVIGTDLARDTLVVFERIMGRVRTTFALKLPMNVRMLSQFILQSSVAVILVLAATIAAADSPGEGAPFLDDRYSIWLGGFFPKVDSHIRLDSSSGVPGNEIDFEDTLGLEDSKTVAFGGFRWRVSPRNLVEFELIQLNRSGLVEGITKPVNIGDHEVRVGGRIESEFDVTIGRLTYGYTVLNTETSELALKAGLHLTKMHTLLRLSGAVFKDGVPVATSTAVDEGEDVAAPLPHLGVSYGYAFNSKFGFRAQGLAFAVKISGYEGTLLDMGLDVQYRPWQRFGVGAGFRYFRITVDDTRDSTLARFQFEYFGPVIYGVYSF
jgi:hypothetical protein